jgi:uncharacterized membrane protein YhhN
MLPLFATAILWGVLYGLVEKRFRPGLRKAAAKTMPVALMAVAVLTGDLPLLLAAALAMSALGDWFLAFDGKNAFMAGLVSFALAHVAYAALLFAGQDTAWTAGMPFFAGVVLVFAYAIGVSRRLRPHLGPMRVPATIYTGLIAAMAVAAWSNGPVPVLIAGVLLFMLSDTILAFDTFVHTGNVERQRWSAPTIWFSYLAAQTLILAHFAREMIFSAPVLS